MIAASFEKKEGLGSLERREKVRLRSSFTGPCMLAVDTSISEQQAGMSTSGSAVDSCSIG